MKRKITKEQKITILIAICITLFLILVTILLINISNSKSNNPKELPEVIDVINNKEALKYDYNECLNTPLKIEEYPTNLNNSIAKLNDYLTKNYMSSKKQISVYYEDLTTGFNFQINEKNTYYAASNIKFLDALYIYTKAIEVKLDLETTLTYSKKFSYKYSKGLEKHKFGDKISLKNLVKYSIIYSDNGAHQMLINYIGKKNLQCFRRRTKIILY